MNTLSATESAALISDTLKRDPFAELDNFLVSRNLTHAASLAASNDLSEIRQLRSYVEERGLVTNNFAVERLCLLHAAREHLPRLEMLPVTDSVKQLFLREFAFFAAPSPRDLPMLDSTKTWFSAWCRLAFLKRFPAGEYHWEESGFPRSWLAQMPARDAPRVLAYLALEMKGFRPCVETHLNPRRPNRFFLIERETYRSYYRLARSIEKQPRIRGIANFSWLYDSSTIDHMPHLSWLIRLFTHNGGVSTSLGQLEGDPDTFGANKRLTELYQEGSWRPQMGCVLWSRDAMIRWADGHKEYAD
jgi:hypothetical protein